MCVRVKDADAMLLIPLTPTKLSPFYTKHKCRGRLPISQGVYQDKPHDTVNISQCTHH